MRLILCLLLFGGIFAAANAFNLMELWAKKQKAFKDALSAGSPHENRCAPGWKKLSDQKCVKIFNSADDEKVAFADAQAKCETAPSYHGKISQLFEVQNSDTAAANVFIRDNSNGSGFLWILTPYSSTNSCYRISEQTGRAEPHSCDEKLFYACAAGQVWVADEDMVRKK